jgi:hypothetical protein
MPVSAWRQAHAAHLQQQALIRLAHGLVLLEVRGVRVVPVVVCAPQGCVSAGSAAGAGWCVCTALQGASVARSAGTQRPAPHHSTWPGPHQGACQLTISQGVLDLSVCEHAATATARATRHSSDTCQRGCLPQACRAACPRWVCKPQGVGAERSHRPPPWPARPAATCTAPRWRSWAAGSCSSSGRSP